MKTVLIVDYEEIGAMLYSYAKILNEHGGDLKCFYASFQNTHQRPHDSNDFHFLKTKSPWDVTKLFEKECCGVTLFNLDSKVRYLKELANRLAPDLVLTAGRGGYLCHRAGLRYVYWAYGSDLEQYAFNLTGEHANQKLMQKFVYHVVNSPFLSSEDPLLINKLTDNIWAEGVRQADRLIVLPRTFKYLGKILKKARLVHLPHCMPVVPSTHRKGGKTLPRQKKFLSTTRQGWGSGKEQLTDYKANDVLVDAIAEYREKTGDDDFELHLIRKGPHVVDTQGRLKKRGLEKYTTWHAEMKRDTLYRLYREATICFGQFGTEALEWSAVEPLAFGVPCISWYGHMDKPHLEGIPFYRELPPIFNSRTSVEISTHLISLLADKDRYRQASEAATGWCQKYCTVAYLQRSLLGMINCAKEAAAFDIDAYWKSLDNRTAEDELNRWIHIAYETCDECQQLVLQAKQI